MREELAASIDRDVRSKKKAKEKAISSWEDEGGAMKPAQKTEKKGGRNRL